ncbi:hypothetical protein C8R43DRAFT_941465 [Mycena crocata]|nr:hypothetical protein C8R43DRAFT_941465 [Mycena crocata]
MSTTKVQRVYSRTYWRDFHQRRAAPSASPAGDFLLGPLQDQAPILTFTNTRVAPLVTVVQNNGTLVTSAPAGPRMLSLPATPPMPLSRVAQHAKALLAARPTPDEILLAQLAAGPASRKRKARTDCTISKSVPTGVSMGGGYHVSDPAYAAYMAGREDFQTLTRIQRERRNRHFQTLSQPGRSDLQRGERYSNMDYILLPSLQVAAPPDLSTEEEDSEVDYEEMPDLETPPDASPPVHEMVRRVSDRMQRHRLRREFKAMRQYAEFFKATLPQDPESHPTHTLIPFEATGLFCTTCTTLTMSSALKCTPPVYTDPGAENLPIGRARFYWYLVTGRGVQAPGAYRSWTSADAEYKKVSSASVKGYDQCDWALLLSAWRASCGRGEHSHEPQDAVLSATPPASPLPPATPPASVRRARARDAQMVSTRHPRDSRLENDSTRPPPSPLRTVVIESRSPSPDPPSSERAYAVRTGGSGEIFDTAAQAKARYQQLMQEGKHPVLGVRRSISGAIDFIEEGDDTAQSISSLSSLNLEEWE